MTLQDSPLDPASRGAGPAGAADARPRPDVIVIMTDEERAAPSYESDELAEWRRTTLTGRGWFDDNAMTFNRHYTGSLACVPSRPTIFTGQYPDVHGVTQTDGLGKMADDSRLRWLPEGEVPTLGHWFRAAGYDTHYDGKWHISHSDLMDETGKPLATNDAAGAVDEAAVQAYLDADPLDPYGFSGWVGPEPHGAPLANSGFRRDPLIAARVVAWLEDRYARRRAGDVEAQKPFLLVASFVNPHDIVLWPLWARKGVPLEDDGSHPPAVAPAPTADEDLASKPAAQIAYQRSYPSAYGPAPAISALYEKRSQEYRDLYYRLHAEVDSPIDQVRKAVTEQGSEHAVLLRTSDHGDLLGAHGGLHQKWYNLYDEATRVPFAISRFVASHGVEQQGGDAGTVESSPTSHVDIIPTLLGAAGIDEAELRPVLAERFSEVHPLPGRNLMPLVDGDEGMDLNRPVYLMTRDNMLEGDTGASGVARKMGKTDNPPLPLRIQVPAHVGTNFEGIVSRVALDVAPEHNLWKLVRTFDDPATWTEPGLRHLAASGLGGDVYRTEPLPDQWELYDLTADPIEAQNRWNDPEAAAVFAAMKDLLKQERARCLPERNNPWPYVANAGVVARASRKAAKAGAPKTAPPPARLLRRAVQKLGMHPVDREAKSFDLSGYRALIVCSNHGVLDVGKPTGVFSSEMTVPYYAFLDAGMEVDIASPLGGVVPIDPQSLKPVIRTEEDDRFLGDATLRGFVADSKAIGDLAMADYDIVFLAGGWGAAFDFGFSEVLGIQMTEANNLNKILGGICHGPLGLRNAKAADGSPLVAGRRMTAVTDKQVNELGISSTPHHPETELRALGARFESQTKFRDPMANHWVVDGNLVTGQNQNAGPMVAREMMTLLAALSADTVG